MSLTKRQILFINHYLQTFNARESALQAGYSQTTADSATANILGSDAVKREIENRLAFVTEENARIFISAARKAIKVLLKILEDPKAAAGTKVAAAREILDRGAHIKRLGLDVGMEGEISEAARKFDHILTRFNRRGAENGASDDREGESEASV